MPYCTNCGSPLQDRDRFCSSCGAPVGKSTDRSGASGGYARNEPPKQQRLYERFAAALNDKMDASSRVMSELTRQENRTRPGRFCHKSCLAEGACCETCVEKQNAIKAKLDALRKMESDGGRFPQQPDDRSEPTGTQGGENAEYTDAALAVCNEMLALLLEVRELSEAQKARITQGGGSWTMAFGRLADTPRGYKHYESMTAQELTAAAAHFDLPFSDYIEQLPAGTTLTSAAIEAEKKTSAALAVGAGLLAAAAASSSNSNMAKTLEQNRQRTKAANDQVNAARQRSLEIDRQAREKNRAGDRALHEQLLKQRSDMAKVDLGIQYKDGLRQDLRRASDKFTTQRKYESDIDRACKDYEDNMRKLHDD